MWVPGYWAWDDFVQDYFWIPGTWALAPRPGLLWTPPYWGWQDGAYLFHSGYWGSHVGFYGGIAYGFGYTGSGYQGAYWNGGRVFYNRSVTNIRNVNVTNVYNKTVIVNRVTNVSYNGGPGGIQARPSPIEQAAMREPRVAPTPLQQQHFQAARANRQLFTSANHGRPPIAAVPRPGQFNKQDIVPTRQAPLYRPPQAGPGNGNPRPQPPGTPPRGSAPPTPNRPDQAGNFGRPAGQSQGRPGQQRPPVNGDGPDGFRQDPNPNHGEMNDQRRDPNATDDRPRAYQDQPHNQAAQQRPASAPHAPPPRPAPAPHAPPQQPHPQSHPHGDGGQAHPQNAGHPKPPPQKKEHERG
jgi:hypothetical protein